MKKLFRRLGPICALGVAILFIFPCYSFAKATPYGSFDVYAPTANLRGWHDVLYGSGDQAKKLDGQCAYIAGLGSYIKSQDFISTSYNNYWSPYSNRSAFPPDNATILGVSIMAVARAQVTKPFTLMIVYGDGFPAQIESLLSPMFYATTTDQVFSYNITADMISEGIITAWNASILKSAISDEWFYVELFSWADTGSFALYVDYVGISYIWCYPAGGEDTGFGDGGTGIFTTPDVIGLLGMTGFIGMIGVPAASIWFFRHDGGGSKIYFGVSALLAFTVCFGFFYASINGG